MTAACLQSAAARVLSTGDAHAKAKAAYDCATAWRGGALRHPDQGAASVAPARPSRPRHPALKPPDQVPRRRLGTQSGRFALLHAVAHIEFNAIDLAFDLIARFGGDPRIAPDQRRAFVSDWVSVGDDEARHFQMVRGRLNELGGDYGDLPAHDGLWDAAEATSDDLAARLAIAPMVLEARGLDVTPSMIERFNAVGDPQSASILEVIYREEIGHVAAGRRWFEAVCKADKVDPKETFQALVSERFGGGLKRPFNEDARNRAGLPADWYETLG